MIIRSILNLWWHSEILKLILGVVRGMFTKRLKRTRRLLYTVKSDFFEMTALGAAHTTPRGEGPQGVGLQA